MTSFSSAENIYAQKITLIDESAKQTSLEAYKGKPLLLVNIATQCGYTKQLDGLEKLYKKYKSKGLVVIGIPSNDFGEQTPEDNKDVKKFCKLRYGVTFPLTKKTVVLGKDKNPLIQELNNFDKKDIAWNFEKYVINKKGEVVNHYKSAITPDDKALIESLEKVLE
ncbi:MAG: glutathione peroxidase [Bdellovibrionaceae bacterium]|nr:glutathione peroxidase [Pseudobdellovibrionaceae bacterium]